MKYKGEEEYPYYYKKQKKKPRVEGDSVYYFLLHNIISMLVFFAFSYPVGLYNEQTELLSDILSFNFFKSILIIFGLMVLSGVIGRAVAYIIIKLVFNLWLDKTTKKLGELNKGSLNKISFSYFISVFISAVIFAFGALGIVQMKLFGNTTFYSLILTYLLIKIIVFFVTRLFSAWNL